MRQVATEPKALVPMNLCLSDFGVLLVGGWSFVPGSIKSLYWTLVIPALKRWESLSGWWVEPSHLTKYARQIGSFPQIGVNMKKHIRNHHPVFVLDCFNSIYFHGNLGVPPNATLPWAL